MDMKSWTPARIPDLGGKTALVTGANSGIGRETARVLAGKGAHVVLVCRSPAKAQAVIAELQGLLPHSRLEFLQLDLSDLDSVRQAAEGFRSRHARLDILCNNAGLMGHATVQRTVQGFEMLFGTNHLGHFALTGLLFDRLTAAPAARVVAVSSATHRLAKSLALDDPGFERTPYQHFRAYAHSKLANLLFVHELQRRARVAGLALRATASHPGYSATGITRGTNQAGNRLKDWSVRIGNALFGLPVSKGAVPTIIAATCPDVRGGEFIGFDGVMELWGRPAPVEPAPLARDAELAAALWRRSEEWTGVRFP